MNTNYRATVAAAEDLRVVVAFDRVEGQEDAPVSVAELPPAFTATIDQMGGDDPLSRATDALVLRWSDPTDDLIWIAASGDCIQTWSQTVDDTGLFEIPAGDLQPPLGAEAGNSTCEVRVALTRTRAGAVDPAFSEYGTFEAKQTRSLRFESAP